ncbi:MAG: selenocysteine-specific translation elongation factor [Kofleriaceae bacterium]
MIVLGTAGHIDHGKTSLVRALTGIDTDRLPVEKARGITTELGFAHFLLHVGTTDQRVAVVDVPGHERFVKSMVAGATGIDVVVLVVAADEGVMPQTREHLDICDLLGVRCGVVALTKSDLVDADWLQLVSADVRGALANTFLADAPIVPCSTKTGAGLDELRAAAATAIAALPPRASTGVFRVPIDRVFTVKGFGTVVTGTILGGSISVGDSLVTIPTGLETKVRGIEVHGAAVESATVGQRVALNLHALAVDQLDRGDMLARPDEVAESHILDIELRYLATAPGPLGKRSKVLLHHATSQSLATLALVGTEELAPGASAIAQLRLPATSPIGALPGDHFIVRGFVATATHGTTIGGGTIVRVSAPRARRGSSHAEAVAALAAAKLEQRIALEVRSSSAVGLSVADLVRRLGATVDVLAVSVADLVDKGELVRVDRSEDPQAASAAVRAESEDSRAASAASRVDDSSRFLHATIVAEIERAIVASSYAPDGITREAVRATLPAALLARAFDVIVDGLATRGVIAVTSGRLTKPAAKAPSLTPVELRVLDRLADGKLEPLRPKELPSALGLTDVQVKVALERLLSAKLVTRIKPDLLVHTDAVVALKGKLLAFLDAHATIDAQQWKDLTGASRKFTIPLAEYFDAERITLRVGDLRRRR